MTFYSSDNKQYTTTRELGRGGEGIVYELQDDSNKVLKYYTEALTPQRVQKLHKMVLMRSPAIDAYAAWPQALVRDASGSVCGFIMRKLSGFMPLHMIFSPLDRKRMFPDKGYNFLVHVARNLAVAFHKLHEAGLVVGDVNEGNILINAQGMVAFIDCDSFQVKGDHGYFYCEVGVPRYTPPELLEMQTFENVVRTTNTDAFSMAVLIFQLLFLGRHPFAGRNRSAADIDEETAIKMREFAYSLTRTKKKLQPPLDSFDIAYLHRDCVEMFQRAFETDIRPTPQDWVKALGEYMALMVTCTISGIHIYPSTTSDCPWCRYRKERGIMYFLDDSYITAHTHLSDINSFVNGFKVSDLALKKIVEPVTLPGIEARTMPRVWDKRASFSFLFMLVVFFAAAIAAFTSLLYLLVGVLIIAFWLIIKPWGKQVKAERKRRQVLYTDALDKMNRAIAKYNNNPDANTYNQELQQLNSDVSTYRSLPEYEQQLQKVMEDKIYNEYLDNYLRQFDLLSHTIPSVGPAKKDVLINAGIRNAADVTFLQTVKVAGIGPKNIQVLLNWRQQMSDGFVYIPDPDALVAGARKVAEDVAERKTQLEHAIRVRYQSLTYRYRNIQNQATVMEADINVFARHAGQAYADVMYFKTYEVVFGFNVFSTLIGSRLFRR